MQIIKGIPVSKGYAVGKIVKIVSDYSSQKTLLQKLAKEFYGLDLGNISRIKIIRDSTADKKLDDNEINKKIKKFSEIINVSKKELKEAKKRLNQFLSLKLAEIIDFQLLALKDTNIYQKTIDIIKDYRISSYLALSIIFNERIEILRRSDNQKVKNRIYDLVDLYNRIASKLKPSGEKNNLFKLSTGGDAIIITVNIFPTDLAEIDFGRVKGMVSQKGSKESHISILLKSIKIPYMLSEDFDLDDIPENQTAVLDTYSGNLIINPDEGTLQKYRDILSPVKEGSILKTRRQEVSEAVKPIVLANLNTLEEIREAEKLNIKGIGLFRTELSFLNNDIGIDMDYQFMAYRKILEFFKDKPVNLRMLDFSGDKQDFINLILKSNLKKDQMEEKMAELLDWQMEAMLRASAYGNLIISLPMVTRPEDFEGFMQRLEKISGKLIRIGIEFNHKIPLDVFIETPGAVLSLEYFLEKCSKISIGTNDLLSLTYATNRIRNKPEESDEWLFLPTLKLLNIIISTAHKHGKIATICGEIAASPRFIPILAGMEIDEISVSLKNYQRVASIVSSIDKIKCMQMVEKLLALNTKKEMMEVVKKYRGSI